jgi:cytoskeletal protein CcmA (bactofilin family)
MRAMVLVSVALAWLSAPAAAQQSELGGKVRAGREVTVPAGETVPGDLVASAATVRVDGRVDGDLVASGGQVIVAGTVGGDVLVGAGSATISGQVGGDLRVGAGQVGIQGRVGEDALVGVGQATLASGARIGGDLIVGAGRMQLDGAVAGSVLGSTGSYSRDGSVGGGERVNVRQPEEQPTLADRILDILRRYVSVLAIGVLVVWLLPRVVRGAADAARGRAAVSLGVGALGFVAVIVALVLVVLVTVLVGVVLGLAGLGSLTGVAVVGGLLVAAMLVFLLVLAVGFAAPATVGLALGRLLVRDQGRWFGGGLGALAIGVLVVVLVAAIPVAGGFLEALVVLLGLGALLLTARAGRPRVAQPSA